MNCQVLIRKDNINVIEERKLTLELFNDPKIPWVHINAENRTIFEQTEQYEFFSADLLKRIANPGKSFLVERIGNTRILDCNIDYEFSKSHVNLLTFCFFPGTVLTITTKGHPLSENLEPSSIIDVTREYDANLVVLTVFRRILDKNTILANKFSKKVDALLKESISEAFDTPATELEYLHSWSIDLNELFEDQLTTLRLLPMNIEEEDLTAIGFLDRVEKSMEHIVHITERSQGKLDYILQRYANVLQQKANARLNTLTIVQAIFVPLTFLAGIYGMNFVNMPELETQSGYFYLLGIMFVLGLGGLYLFYRNGWFNSK